MKIMWKDESLPDGSERYVKGLGMLVNGRSMEFSAEEVRAFEAASGRKFDKAFANNPNIKLAKGGDDN